MRTGHPEKPALQAERTELSWERTAVGFLVTAAFVLFRLDGPLADGRTAVALLAILLALSTLGIGQSRARRFRRKTPSGEPDVRISATAMRFVGWSTACLATVIVIFLVLTVRHG